MIPTMTRLFQNFKYAEDALGLKFNKKAKRLQEKEAKRKKAKTLFTVFLNCCNATPSNTAYATQLESGIKAHKFT
jgi:hypothetical protein